MSAFVSRLCVAAALVICVGGVGGVGTVNAADRGRSGDRGGDRGGDRDRGGWQGRDSGRGWHGDNNTRGRDWGGGHDRGRDGFSFRFSIGSRDRCDPPRPVYCPPVYRAPAYCPPVYRAPAYCPPVYRRPVVIDPCPPPVYVRPCEPVRIVETCPPPRRTIVIEQRRPEIIVVDRQIERPYEADDTVVVRRPSYEPTRVVVDQPVYQSTQVVQTQQVDPFRQAVPAAIIVTNGVRESEDYTSYIAFGAKRVKTIVTVRNSHGRLNATARFVGDGCDLPELNAVTLKIRGDGDIWTGPMRCVEPAGARAEYSIENLRWRGGDNVQIELQVADALTKQCVRW